MNSSYPSLVLPVSKEELSKLHIGDIFYLSGTLFTGRDEVYHRIVEEGITPPVELKGIANYHAGPIVKNDNELISIGPTTSARMEKWAADFIAKTGVKILIGKGGMGEKTAAVCKEHGAIHCVYPGGCAVLGASQIEKIEGVFWRELGMAECVWMLKAVNFGPLAVCIDTKGNNLFSQNAAYYAQRRRGLFVSPAIR